MAPHLQHELESQGELNTAFDGHQTEDNVKGLATVAFNGNNNSERQAVSVAEVKQSDNGLADSMDRTADSVKEGQHAPDGGWGWAIVAGAFVLNLLIGGAVNSFGILYVELLDLHKQSAGKTAWVGSMANAMGLLLGPLSSALSTRFSCRKMVIVGGVLVAAGWISTGYMPRLEYMFLTYGLLAGIGKSLAYIPSVVMVGQWFDKRRSLANGISVSGAGVGTFAFAPLLALLLDKMKFSHTMLIMGIVMFLICVCGGLFRPVPHHTSTDNEASVVQTIETKGHVNIGYSEENNINIIRNNNSRNVTETGRNMILSNESANKDLKDVSRNQTVDHQHGGKRNNFDCENNSEKTIDDETHNGDDSKNRQSNLPDKKTLKDYIDYTLLKKPPFLCFGVSVMLATLGHSPASVMLPSLAKQSHVAPEKAAFLLSIIGIMDILGRLLFGALCDIKKLKDNRKYLYVASIFISGVANIVCTFSYQYWHFFLYSVVFGLFAGSYNALTPVILVDLLGVDKLASSFGLALLFQGLGFLVGPPLGGLIKDQTNSYKSAFYFAGVGMVTSSIVMNLMSACKRLMTRSRSLNNALQIADTPERIVGTAKSSVIVISVKERKEAELLDCSEK